MNTNGMKIGINATPDGCGSQGYYPLSSKEEFLAWNPNGRAPFVLKGLVNGEVISWGRIEGDESNAGKILEKTYIFSKMGLYVVSCGLKIVLKRHFEEESAVFGVDFHEEDIADAWLEIILSGDVKSVWEFDEETHSHFLKRIGFRERETA